MCYVTRMGSCEGLNLTLQACESWEKESELSQPKTVVCFAHPKTNAKCPKHPISLVPIVLNEKPMRIPAGLAGQNIHVSVIFDGTIRLGEVLAVVITVADWKVEQRLVHLHHSLCVWCLPHPKEW